MKINLTTGLEGRIYSVDAGAYVYLLMKFRAGDVLNWRNAVNKLACRMPDEDISSVHYWVANIGSPGLCLIEVCCRASIADELQEQTRQEPGAFQAYISITKS
jgi:hypothetical protein